MPISPQTEIRSQTAAEGSAKQVAYPVMFQSSTCPSPQEIIKRKTVIESVGIQSPCYERSDAILVHKLPNSLYATERDYRVQGNGRMVVR